MKKWYAFTCPGCGFRQYPAKFNPSMKPILYPVQIVTGGGRAKGFHVEEYIPWEALPRLQQTAIWPSLLCLYTRIASANDHFFEVLGYVSPKMKTLLQQLQRTYADSYLTPPFPEYTKPYATDSLHDIVESYVEDDYSKAYAYLRDNPTFEGIHNG
jgi:hypothetical protein